MAFTGRIEDRFAIRELYGTYAAASWRWRGVAMERRGDGEQWLGCFTPDGRWTSHLFDASGHAAPRATWDGLWQDWQSVAFLGEIGSMEITGEAARCRSYAWEIMRLKSGATFKLAGRYDDAPVKSDGMRRLSLRAYTLMIDEVLPGLFDA